MSRKQTLPYDVRLECIAYVRGYHGGYRRTTTPRSRDTERREQSTEGMPRSPALVDRQRARRSSLPP